jgi:hypothetical protein
LLVASSRRRHKCGCGGPDKQKKKLTDHLKAIALLKDRDLHWTCVIEAYHARRVAPLMVCPPAVRDDA